MAGSTAPQNLASKHSSRSKIALKLTSKMVFRTPVPLLRPENWLHFTRLKNRIQILNFVLPANFGAFAPLPRSAVLHMACAVIGIREVNKVTKAKNNTTRVPWVKLGSTQQYQPLMPWVNVFSTKHYLVPGILSEFVSARNAPIGEGRLGIIGDFDLVEAFKLLGNHFHEACNLPFQTRCFLDRRVSSGTSTIMTR